MAKQAQTQAPLSFPARIQTAEDLGRFLRQYRQSLNLSQADVVGLANTGNRFIVELERGKPTVQLQKSLDVIDLLGLEVVIRKKGD